jgi:glycosyltransferase involved in cell wall biosynthesis
MMEGSRSRRTWRSGAVGAILHRTEPHEGAGAALHIGVDGLHLFGAYGGVQFALTRLLAALAEGFPSDRFSLFVPRDFDERTLKFRATGDDDDDAPRREHADAGQAGAATPFTFQRTWFPGRWRTMRTLWRNFRLQSWAYGRKCDLLHGPTYALPAALSLPAVVTIHDVIPLTHPEFCTPGSARIQKHQLPRSIKVARRILVPTEAVKGEVERVLHVDPGRIAVAPWGVGPEFRVLGAGTLAAAREKWKLPAQFVLFVGTIEPKKNVAGLIKSFFAAKVHRRLPHELVFAGRMGWKMKGLARLVRELGATEYTHHLGYVPEEDLPAIYGLAEACVVPSHVEGFGMPVLEAFACGCPLVISAVPALVEVAGGAARVCPFAPDKPYQPLREALEEVLLDEGGVRATLREKGLARAKEFTWRRTAELTHAAYEKALE